ncbi:MULTISPECIES: hypothetical protein [unclassified Neorhizobium]|uniref:hypothetical protein n=1 Tax=unclassified Neorhizobium TaxID=2629175 RepID=UPI001FF50A4A|nr:MULTISPECIES: hypothetical protein [unclassified Neorhizobium]MCJ9669029.1 hypothetical protein [Neorhizobium sp. SHOUNA12B]MCJ9744983.1 hypothetical protein [Neorhizobium sp. SHOUNA12A]
MTLSQFQSDVVSTLAANRTPRSFFSGSAILGGYLRRRVGDIDIHCVSEPDYVSSMDTDLATLEKHAIAAKPLLRREAETEMMICRDDEVTAINWVVSGEPRICPPIADREFGWRVSLADAVLEKLLMAEGSDPIKHYDDLGECANAGLFSFDLVLIAAASNHSLRLVDAADAIVAALIRSTNLNAAAASKIIAARARFMRVSNV